MDSTNQNINTCSTQSASIRSWLEAGKTITAGEALKQFSCFRLAARINDLRMSGMQISSRQIAVTNAQGKKVRVAEYELAKKVSV